MVTDLSKVGADEFEAAVNADVRGTASQETRDGLRQPHVLDRWHDCLLHLKANVEAQFTSNRASLLADQVRLIANSDVTGWLEAKAESEQWRQRSIRFKNGVEERLREAKRLRRERDGEAWSQAEQLRSAILAHRKAVLSDPENPDAVDDELWAVLG